MGKKVKKFRPIKRWAPTNQRMYPVVELLTRSRKQAGNLSVTKYSAVRVLVIADTPANRKRLGVKRG